MCHSFPVDLQNFEVNVSGLDCRSKAGDIDSFQFLVRYWSSFSRLLGRMLFVVISVATCFPRSSIPLEEIDLVAIVWRPWSPR